MIIKILTVSILYFITGLSICTAIVVPYKNINKELLPYHNRFMRLTNMVCKPKQYFYPERIDIEFKKLRSPTIGYCAYNSVEFNIYIDREYWKQASEDTKEVLIFHEMTHCVLQLNHVKNKNNYMYESVNTNISKEVVEIQTLINIAKICPKE